MSISLDPENDWKNKIADQILKDLLEINKLQGNSIKKMKSRPKWCFLCRTGKSQLRTSLRPSEFHLADFLLRTPTVICALLETIRSTIIFTSLYRLL